MCGIAGFTLYKALQFDIQHTVQQMTAALTHRGPDDEGFYIDHAVALGSRRLSIIDLSGGKMPIHNEDRSLWIVFNGEIYNFLPLRKQLLEQGHTFLTHSDTEVILHLYEEYGSECVAHLNGMFAFALWDASQQSLFLARDRLGIKPLHYAEYPGGIVFASEIKALLHHPAIEARLDLRSLNKYLLYEYVPAPHSIFQGIRKLLPGCWMRHTAEKTEIQQYWDIPQRQNDVVALDEEEQADELLRRLRESVRKRLISDVPVGVLLSGGLDSSTIALLAAEESSDRIQSFSIGFEESSFDESRYAQQIADLSGSRHHHQVFTHHSLIEMLPQVFAMLDEPLADASIIPTYLLSGMTAQSVKVALGGDGADELFAGYPLYQAHRLAAYYTRMPGFMQSMIRTVVYALPVSHRYQSVDFKLKQFLRGIEAEPDIRFFLWRSAFLEQETRKLLLPEVQEALDNQEHYEDITSYRTRMNKADAFDHMLYLGMKLYLQDDILVKVDRASMANSLEVRVPFLDHTLVEFAAALPPSYKLRGLTPKYLLKRAVRGLVPPEILSRKKKGFGIPLSKWFQQDLHDVLQDYFDEHRLKQAGIFNTQYVRTLLNEHTSRTRDNRKQLWTLLVFEMWREQYLSNL